MATWFRSRTAAMRRGVWSSAKEWMPHPVWSPDGNHVAFISTERYDWVTVSYLYLVHPSTLERRKITPDFDEKIKTFFWTSDSKRILFIAGDRTASQIYSVDIETSEVEALTNGG